MKRLYKIIPVIAMAVTLAACANEPSSVSAPPILSNSNDTVESLSTIASSTADSSIDSTLSSNTPYVPTKNSESSTAIKTESTTSRASESNPEITGTSSVSSSSTTESLPENETETKENPGMFDFDSKAVTLNSGYIMPINGLGTYSLTGNACFDSVSTNL